MSKYLSPSPVRDKDLCYGAITSDGTFVVAYLDMPSGILFDFHVVKDDSGDEYPATDEQKADAYPALRMIAAYENPTMRFLLPEEHASSVARWSNSR